jgi:hypothetical protein
MLNPAYPYLRKTFALKHLSKNCQFKESNALKILALNKAISIDYFSAVVIISWAK